MKILLKSIIVLCVAVRIRYVKELVQMVPSNIRKGKSEKMNSKRK